MLWSKGSSFNYFLAVCIAAAGLTGCKEKPGGAPAGAPAAEVSGQGSQSPGSDTASGPAAAPPGSPMAVSASGTSQAGVDDQDDPRGPAFLPQTGMSGPWVKREAVRVFDPGELVTAVSAEGTSRLGYFRIRSIARCAYELPHSTGRRPLARVLAISTDTAEDAYGVLGCRAPAGELFRICGETRVTRRDGVGLHSWQGTTYLCVTSDQSDAETTEELIRLMNHICGRIRRESVPPILEALPRDTSVVHYRWLMRNLASLPGESLELVERMDVRKLNEVLGLSRETIMCVGAYSLRGGSGPNVVWVVQYPNVRAAHDAATRYKKYLDENPGDPLAASTNLLPPQGLFLAGTWTAEEESMQYMLPRVQQLLPPS